MMGKKNDSQISKLNSWTMAILVEPTKNIEWKKGNDPKCYVGRDVYLIIKYMI